MQACASLRSTLRKQRPTKWSPVPSLFNPRPLSFFSLFFSCGSFRGNIFIVVAVTDIYIIFTNFTHITDSTNFTDPTNFTDQQILPDFRQRRLLHAISRDKDAMLKSLQALVSSITQHRRGYPSYLSNIDRSIAGVKLQEEGSSPTRRPREHQGDEKVAAVAASKAKSPTPLLI